MATNYQTDKLFDGVKITHNKFVVVEDGRIAQISEKQPQGEVLKLSGLLCPGFVDTQVNGGGGVLLNQSPTLDTLDKMSRAHLAYGTTSMLPTVITDNFDVMQSAANAVATSIVSGSSLVVGIHFEGPHLSTAKKGIHPETHIRGLSEKEFALFTRKDIGKVLVTLAPENVSPEDITKLVNSGVTVSLGHSNANADLVQQAIDAGATGFTHLFNAMSPLQSRDPGMVGTALSDQDSFCGMIVDFHHVHPVACQLAIKCKSAKHIMLVTDAMSHVGSVHTSLPYGDTQITLQDGKLTVPDGTLAGSALDMISAVKNCHQRLALSLEESLLMATNTPAQFLGLEKQVGNLAPGAVANMLLLDNDLSIKARWINGKLIKGFPLQ